MPVCHARYDVYFNDGTGIAAWAGPGHQAVVDMMEDRLPDDWGDPGRLVAAQLYAWRAQRVRSIEYGPVGHRKRMGLWVDGTPRITRAHRRHLRWWIPDEDPPPHDDPEWILPP